MINFFDIPIIICIAVIFKFSGNIDVLLSFIFSIFLYYTIKMIIYNKYNKEQVNYEIKNMINVEEEMTNDVKIDTKNNMDELYKI